MRQALLWFSLWAFVAIVLTFVFRFDANAVGPCMTGGALVSIAFDVLSKRLNLS